MVLSYYYGVGLLCVLYMCDLLGIVFLVLWVVKCVFDLKYIFNFGKFGFGDEIGLYVDW